MEVHPYLQQKAFNQMLKVQTIHVVQFSPLGNMNDFYRQTGWAKGISHMRRLIDHPILQGIGKKYNKAPVHVFLAWGIKSGRSVIPKSVVEWQIEENLGADIGLGGDYMGVIGRFYVKARFNDPRMDYEWRLYGDLDGIERTVRGRTH